MRILLLSISLLLFGCVTQQRCLEKFPPQVTTIEHTHDSIVTVIDTVLVPFQELSFDTTSPCPPQVVFNRTVTRSGLTTSVSIKDGKLSVKCTADSLQAIVNAQKEYITKTIRETLKPIEITVKDRWYYIWRALALTFMGLALLIIVGLIYVK